MRVGTGACESPQATSPPSLFGGLTVEVSDGALVDWLLEFDPAIPAILDRATAHGVAEPAVVLRVPRSADGFVYSKAENPEDVSFLGRPSIVTTRGSRTTVDTPARGVRIVFDRDRAIVSGVDVRQVGLSAGVLAMAWCAERARDAGWHVVHASCFVHNGSGVLCLGTKGSGKSTLALTAATRCGARLLANDRCLVRVVDGAVSARSLPQPVAVGFGLVAALGWGPALSAAVQHDSMRHPSVRGPRLEAARRYRDTALVNENGVEVKMPFLSGELGRLFGVRTAAETTVDTVLYPRLRSGRAHYRTRPAADLDSADMLVDDVGGPAGGWLHSRTPVAEGLLLPVPAFDLRLPRCVEAVERAISRIPRGTTQSAAKAIP